MPLKFTLRPGEKVIVNGAVIGRGEEPGSFYLFNKANFLRGREVMKDSSADTVEKKLYLIIQLIYLFPENAPENLVKFEAILAETMRHRTDALEALTEVARLVHGGDYYRALKATAKLF
ncbi:MAG: flagellar biosynthesis repressor FlbT [Proteobacteria bacterium]|nr:flagellar biosynthesis repressor FlbT [Pseudomonadota bacterium]